MMARSVRRNGTALSRRWKLGGEDNRSADKKKEKEKKKKGDIVSKKLEGAVVERVLLVTRFFSAALGIASSFVLLQKFLEK
jgi:hypothetical protein